MAESQIRFLSGNEFKIGEAKKILEPCGIEVVPIEYKIDELQTTDSEKLVRDKALKAFGHTARPLFVEHTGLYLEHLNGFPGGLTQVFWDTLGPDRFSELFGRTANTKVLAKTIVGYVDGRRIHVFEGAIKGTIADNPRGDRSFQWDCVFIPEGYKETFAELGSKKNEISMRRKALDALATFIKKNGVAGCKH